MDSAQTAKTSTKQVRELFDAAYQMPESEQETWVAAQVNHSVETRDAALRLLRGSRRSGGGFLSKPILHTPQDQQREGVQIGSYRVIRELGGGGMGVVYLCERADGLYQRRLALKLLRPTHNSVAMRDRFSAERVILAKLDHENIARIVDGGTTEDGLPYLLMDYVEGAPIDVHSRKHSLDLPERIALFCKVCSAVQYLHEQGVFHGDLKPSNILVHVDGRVKLLDFGIAKLLDESGSAPQQAVMGTANYVSPEQLEGLPVTPAADVYSLSVVLYELLALKTPFEGQATDSAAALLAARKVKLPAMSSTAASTDAPWSGSIRGDLDRIAAVGLSQSPMHRYPTAKALEEDLRRFIAHEPIRARKRTPLYVGGHFLRRHWQMATAVLIIVMALTGAGWAVTDMLTMRATVAQEAQTQRAMEQAYRAQLAHAGGTMDVEAVRAQIERVRANFASLIEPMLDDPLAPRHDMRILAAESADFLTVMAPVALRDPESAQNLLNAYIGISELQWNETGKSLHDPAAAQRTARLALSSANTLLRTPDGRHRLALLLPRIAHQLRLSALAATREAS